MWSFWSSAPLCEHAHPNPEFICMCSVQPFFNVQFKCHLRISLLEMIWQNTIDFLNIRNEWEVEDHRASKAGYIGRPLLLACKRPFMMPLVQTSSSFPRARRKGSLSGVSSYKGTNSITGIQPS